MGEIRVGTSGYSFPDWKGTVYPANIRDADMFSWYVNQFRFNTVEMNHTYYRQPAVRTFDALLKKSPVDFDFTIKLYGGITHEPWKDPPSRVDMELCSQFLDGIKPVVESGKLGCLLAQFPMSVSRSQGAWDYILALPEALNGLPLVFEFRNKSWVSEETVQRLKAEGIGFCAVDEPKMGSLMPLVPAVTSDIAYLRLHGKSESWFKNKALRYDYLYSERELQKLLPTISRMSAASRTLYIMFNNCHAGAAVMNVRMLQDLLGMDVPTNQAVLFP